MKRFRYLLVIVLLASMGASCSKYDQRLEIADLQKPQVITLHKKSDQGNIYSMRIRGSGKLNSEARIVLMLNEKPYKTEQMNGKVNFTWGGDWYSDSMELRYQPLKVNSGIFVIEYYFADLK